jgi:hypothetical protein
LSGIEIWFWIFFWYLRPGISSLDFDWQLYLSAGNTCSPPLRSPSWPTCVRTLNYIHSHSFVLV